MINTFFDPDRPNGRPGHAQLGHMHLGPALINQTQIRRVLVRWGPSEPEVTQARLQEFTS